MMNKIKHLTRLLNYLENHKNQSNNIDLSCIFEKASYDLWHYDDKDNSFGKDVKTDYILIDAFKKSNLYEGFKVINSLLTALSNPKLMVTKASNYKIPLSKMTNGVNNTGKLYVYNPAKPQDLRLATSQDLIHAIKNVLNTKIFVHK